MNKTSEELTEEVLNETQQIEEYKREIDFVRKCAGFFKESLEKSTEDAIAELEALGIKNAGIRKTLKTRIIELPEYKNLFRPTFWKDSRIKMITPFTVIRTIMDHENCVFYWVKDSGYIGFVFYNNLEDIADNVTVFMFDKNGSPAVIKTDNVGFMNDIIDKHRLTKWETLKTNEKTVSCYDIFLAQKEKEGYVVSRKEGMGEDADVIFYSIENLKRGVNSNE